MHASPPHCPLTVRFRTDIATQIERLFIQAALPPARSLTGATKPAGSPSRLSRHDLPARKNPRPE
jgi:hypothetical protein